MRSWREEFTYPTKEEKEWYLSADAYRAEHGEPKPWYDCLPHIVFYMRMEVGHEQNERDDPN